jgi:uncharacterized LabA/DUF88 family protein
MRPRRKQKPVYAFIDSQNLNQSIQRLGWKMDWHKFRQFLQDKYGVTHAYMFIGYVPEFEAMYQQLHETGYLIVLKPTYDMTRPRPEDKPESDDPKKDKDDKKPTKGNIDADLVLWAMKEMPNYGRAVLVSGDGDFYSLVEYLDQQKKLAKILAPSMYYSGLYNRYDSYIERLDLHRGELAYRDGRKRSKRPADKN